MKGFIHLQGLLAIFTHNFGLFRRSFGFIRTRINGFIRLATVFIAVPIKFWQWFSELIFIFFEKKIKINFLRDEVKNKLTTFLRKPFGKLRTFQKVLGSLFFTSSLNHLPITLLIFFTTSCYNKQPREVKTAFYHWKTESTLSNVEKQYLKNLKVEKLYVRLFDIDWDETTQFPKPLASTNSLKNLGDTIEIIPTLYFTNKTFAKLSENLVDSLANLVFQKIIKNSNGTSPNNREGVNFNEIQIDCDWTESTKARFFSFLKALKAISHKYISATIRLHQVKYFEKTGVPPVDKGTLMAYNMGTLDDPQTQNSILDTTILKSYLKNFENYPLKLDIALPLFSWGIVIRDGEAVKIINNLSEQDFLEIDNSRKKEGFELYENKVRILKNLYFESYYLYKDDEIRLENTPLSILKPTADLLAQHLNNQQLTVSFFHLDSRIIQRYHYEDLQDIINRFH